MTVAFEKMPFPITRRELWLPRTVNGTQLPAFRSDGHPITLTGATRQTTCDGARFTGVATANINCGAIHNAQAKLAVSLRFKLFRAYAAGDGDQYIWGKYIDADNYIRLYLSTADGLLHLKHRSGAADLFDISVGTAFAGQTWYHVYFATGQSAVGGAPSDGARLRLDNGTAATNADVTALPNGGDFVIGDYDDPGAGTGLRGIIADFFAYTDDVALYEEADNYKGIPSTDAVHVYLLDEGRGTTANDKGSGANNGTLDTSTTWAWGQVAQSCISFDRINDIGASSAGVNIAGDLTIVWVGKMKSTYSDLNMGAGSQCVMLMARINDPNLIKMNYFDGTDTMDFVVAIGGVEYITPFTTPKPAIDDYWVRIGVIDSGVRNYSYLNGTLRDSVACTVNMPGLAATMGIGHAIFPTQWDISKMLRLEVIEGALTAKQVLAYTRYLKNLYNLPISI